MTELTVFAKREISLRYWLQGRGYHSALRALELVKLYEEGEYRKDGTTPNVDHMIEIALYVSRLPNVRDMETLLVACLLHDLVEDHGVPIEVVRSLFGNQAANAIWNVTKKIPIFSGGATVDVSFLSLDGDKILLNKGGEKVGVHERDEDDLYVAMSFDPIASLVKPADRSHNQKTMAGVFGHQKQVDYVQFTDGRILPMMKIARRRFPDQEPAYVMIETLLKAQARIVRGWAAEKSK